MLSRLNETVSAGGCVFRCPRFALGSGVSGKDLVARSIAIPQAGCQLLRGRCCRRNPRKSDCDNHAPLTYWLFNWTGSWASAGAVDRAMEIVWRYDWNARSWFEDVTDYMLGAAGDLLRMSTKSAGACI